MCTSNGTFTPTNMGTCVVPADCGALPDPDSATSGLVPSGPNSTIAYRLASFACNETALTTDVGKTISVLCKADGTYDIPAAWPVCRWPVNCVEYVPLPPLDTGLADSTSTANKEGDEAIYTCIDSPTFLINGVDADFRLVCGSNGSFSSPIGWPTCIDPTVTTTSTTTEKPLDPCQCLGDIPVAQAIVVLDNFCRDPDLPGNVFNYAGYTPPSRKRCGNRSPANPTVENHCFCDSVAEQASKFIIKKSTKAHACIFSK